MVDIVMSKRGKKARVPSKATGMPIATHIAILNFKKRVKMISTNIRPPPAFFSSTFIRSLNSSEVSIHMSRLISFGRLALNLSTTTFVSRAICIRSSFPT